jgi:hypothetical protein
MPLELCSYRMEQPSRSTGSTSIDPHAMTIGAVSRPGSALPGLRRAKDRGPRSGAARQFQFPESTDLGGQVKPLLALWRGGDRS